MNTTLLQALDRILEHPERADEKDLALLQMALEALAYYISNGRMPWEEE